MYLTDNLYLDNDTGNWYGKRDFEREAERAFVRHLVPEPLELAGVPDPQPLSLVAMEARQEEESLPSRTF